MPRIRGNAMKERYLTELGMFQKTPISILEELFPNQAVYTWAVARNFGSTDLFRCRVEIRNNTNGESISFSKKVAKHQAALDALRNLQLSTRNTELERFIRQYTFGGADILDYKNGFSEYTDCPSQDYRGEPRRSRSRSVSRTRSMGFRSRSRSKSLTRSRSLSRYSKPRSRSRARYWQNCEPREWDESIVEKCQPYDLAIFHGVNPQIDPVGFLEEECKLIGKPGPEYLCNHRRNSKNEVRVNAILGPFNAKGYGFTEEIAQQEAATALINSLFVNQDEIEME